MKMNINQYIRTVLFVPAVFICASVSMPAFSETEKQADQDVPMPPPGPYRSLGAMKNTTHPMAMAPAAMPKMQYPAARPGAYAPPPPWMQNQQPRPMPQFARPGVQKMPPQMPEWMKKQQQQQQEKMQAYFEKQKAEFEKRKQAQTAEQNAKPADKKDWARLQEENRKRMKEMHENAPKTYAEWEEKRQAEIKKQMEAYKKHQAEAKKRYEAFKQRQEEARKQFEASQKQQKNNNKDESTAEKTAPAVPEWYVKQQQQARKQAEYYRAQQQKWMAQQQQQAFRAPAPVWQRPPQAPVQNMYPAPAYRNNQPQTPPPAYRPRPQQPAAPVPYQPYPAYPPMAPWR